MKRRREALYLETPHLAFSHSLPHGHLKPGVDHHGFVRPAALALLPGNFLALVDGGSHRLQVFRAPDGGGKRVLGKRGRSRVGEFCSPSGIATDGSDWLYVADSHNGRVQKLPLNGSGEGFKSTACELRHPCGLALARGDRGASSDRLFVSDSAARCIHVLRCDDLSLERSFGGSGGGGVHAEQTGARHAHGSSLRSPGGLAIDEQRGCVLVADAHAHRIVCFSLDGKLLEAFGGAGETPGQFDFPTGVAIAERGGKRLLLVSEGGGRRLQVLEWLEQSGTYAALEWHAPEGCGSLNDVCVSDTHVWVTAPDEQQIHAFEWRDHVTA